MTYILSIGINEYNQQGSYHLAIFEKRPSLVQLSKVLFNVESLETLEEKDLLDVATLLRNGEVTIENDVFTLCIESFDVLLQEVENIHYMRIRYQK